MSGSARHVASGVNLRKEAASGPDLTETSKEKNLKVNAVISEKLVYFLCQLKGDLQHERRMVQLRLVCTNVQGVAVVQT